MWFNYASDKPFGQMAVITLVLILTSRYFILGTEKGTHLFADIQDFAFGLHGLNSTSAPALIAVRNHIVSNYINQEKIFRIHVICTGLAWGLMPFQLWASFRKSDYNRHKQLGWFILSVLAIGMITSFWIARPIRDIEEAGGMTTEFGFYGMAIATSFCAIMGVIKIKQGKIEEHRNWMVRAYGTMWGAFFWFRIGMVVFLPLVPKKYNHGLGLISNLSWMVGWMGADVALSLSPLKKGKVKAVVAAGNAGELNKKDE